MVNYSWEDTLRIYVDVAGWPAEVRPQVARGDGHLAVIRDFVATIAAATGRATTARTACAGHRLSRRYASAQTGREVVMGQGTVGRSESVCRITDPLTHRLTNPPTHRNRSQP